MAELKAWSHGVRKANCIHLMNLASKHETMYQRTNWYTTLFLQRPCYNVFYDEIAFI